MSPGLSYDQYLCWKLAGACLILKTETLIHTSFCIIPHLELGTLMTLLLMDVMK